MERVRILLLMALRSLGGHKIKGLIVGSLLAFGTFLFVMGTTLLENIERAMEASITQSITGHVQLVSKDAVDRLAFFGPDASSEQDLGVLEDFPRIREVASRVPGVAAVVPMGRYYGQPILNTELDEAIEALEEAVAGGDAELIEDRIGKVRRMTKTLHEDFERLRLLVREDDPETEKALQVLDKATSDAFWEELRANPEAGLQFLSFEVAKLSDDQTMVYLPFIGTDLHRYAESFVHFEMVSGEMPPPGSRGILISQAAYDQNFKNRPARLLELIHEARTLDRRTIADDPRLQDMVERLKEMTAQVTMHLTPQATAELDADLRARFPEVEGDLDDRLAAFFAVDDANFDERYAYFQERIVPLIPLYRVPVGGTFTLRSMTKSGYPKAVNVKLWGTFRFKGLERSELASAYSLIDLASFRDLLGLMTAEKRRELDTIRSEIEVEEIDADDVEAFLFGAEPELEIGSVEEGLDLDARLEALDVAEGGTPETFDPAEIEKGTILNAAVVLDDPSSLSKTMVLLEEAFEREGLRVKAIPWTEVTGVVGQLVVVLRVVLYVLIGIIFIVALVIINNSMVMATMDRIGEIGTMRAIGAGRGFVLVLFLLETLVLGLFASALGALGATGILAALGSSGIHTHEPFFIFLFGGTALYPAIDVANVVWGFVVIVIISVISTLYPARLAARVPPIVAMQGKE
ncbi:MAG TPA: FtsX-like permease family protein [Fredinandcohnia sp.]|nr:FtsX-like permease family protein [Fredinandcohnia sp.]